MYSRDGAVDGNDRLSMAIFAMGSTALSILREIKVQFCRCLFMNQKTRCERMEHNNHTGAFGYKCPDYFQPTEEIPYASPAAV